MTKSFFTVAVIALAGGLSACNGPSKQTDYLVSCMFDVSAPGEYQSAAAAQVPVVSPVPGTGATQAGADALNACIRKKAAAAGSV
ncbi:MAG: hypothetical protein AB3N15_01445 [Paracoccaceae bacterium]